MPANTLEIYETSLFGRAASFGPNPLVLAYVYVGGGQLTHLGVQRGKLAVKSNGFSSNGHGVIGGCSKLLSRDKKQGVVRHGRNAGRPGGLFSGTLECC